MHPHFSVDCDALIPDFAPGLPKSSLEVHSRRDDLQSQRTIRLDCFHESRKQTELSPARCYHADLAPLHARLSHWMVSSSSTLSRKVRPTNAGNSFGAIPLPGLLMVRSLNVRECPADNARAATTLLRATAIFGISDLVGILIPSPSANSMCRIAETISRNSPGSSDAA